MDGLDVVRALRARAEFGSTAIVVLTGAAQRHLKAAAFAAGADDYIVKPLASQHLAARLRGAIKNARRGPSVGARTMPAARSPDPLIHSQGHFPLQFEADENRDLGPTRSRPDGGPQAGRTGSRFAEPSRPTRLSRVAATSALPGRHMLEP